ncbi:hypothetical protein A3I34_00640 [Candidatus Jorgensenbacteria bacterium RIFCSPLOWO2_02_FULL_45_12]|uniref:Uncharacterized protein n=2 Tax=Candidatus Joergenseniibacteriota TaxID=1752739 RepID=A0A1F6BML9_9BACT|nr:MAG: hypothetical protein UX22_C0005G0006 [Candidatus Jorgensenbacteria bacterium GW2011_GWA2_45_9]OGG38160.1 MAG: hypothetical protein A3D55_00620 [Candidatus Jorgensenbacteria bacterium RIFCSPHIGHO2_02_FULL_45_20]OGG42562.1 MAG: hypothetical protein A3I34_00640 [Candidatus Jorgensenbacteria bacterium RIFCSPLOWO2_02_FULL_45_12]
MTPEPTIISQSADSETDKNNLKIFILGVLGIGISAISAYALSLFLQSPKFAFLLAWMCSVAVFASFILLQSVFVKGGWKLTLMIFLQGLSPAAVFYRYIYPDVSWPVVGGIIAFTLLLIASSIKGRSILSNSLNIKFSFIAKSVVPLAVAGALIFSSAAAYVFYFEKGGFSRELGLSLISKALASAEPVLHLWFPETSFGQTPEVFFENLARTQFEKISFSEASVNFSVQDFKALPKEEQEKIISEAGAKIREAVESGYGAIRDDEPVSNAAFGILERWVKDVELKLGGAFGALVAILGFLALRGIFALFHWLITLLAFLVYRFLLVTGFAAVILETRRREFVLLP